MLICEEFGSGILVPDRRPHAPSPNLTLTVVADINKIASSMAHSTYVQPDVV